MFEAAELWREGGARTRFVICQVLLLADLMVALLKLGHGGGSTVSLARLHTDLKHPEHTDGISEESRPYPTTCTGSRCRVHATPGGGAITPKCKGALANQINQSLHTEEEVKLKGET